jgi:isoquinoline 1-oxidoreductase beta subunit
MVTRSGSVRVEYTREEPPGVRTGFWRGVGPNDNVFAIESFMDDVARRLGRDPVDFRLSMLGKSPRLAAALKLVAQKSGWGTPLPRLVGRGVAVQGSFGSFIATVAEVAVDATGVARTRRIVCAVDTGTLINPDTVVAQLQGGLIFGLTAALYGRITVQRGRVEQGNFHDYRMVRIDEAPVIEVHLVPSSEPPGGIGETGTVASLPAIRNAILAATGVPLTRMPIDPALLRSAGA